MKVLIVDDQQLFAEAVSWSLAGGGHSISVAVATTGEAGIHASRRDPPDVAVVDFLLPDISGVDVGRTILEENPGTKVVMVTANRHDQALIEARRAGFHGLLSKDTPLGEFVGAIEQALKGGTVMSRPLPGTASQVRSPKKRDAPRAPQLTAQERKVLALLAEGASGAEMAKRLSLSVNTVRSHVQSILTKLQVHSRLEAVAFAARHGLIKR